MFGKKPTQEKESEIVKVLCLFIDQLSEINAKLDDLTIKVNTIHEAYKSINTPK